MKECRGSAEGLRTLADRPDSSEGWCWGVGSAWDAIGISTYKSITVRPHRRSSEFGFSRLSTHLRKHARGTPPPPNTHQPHLNATTVVLLRRMGALLFNAYHACTPFLLQKARYLKKTDIHISNLGELS